MSKLKNILGKLRPDRTDQKLAKNVERIAVIGHSSDAVGWRPVSYRTPERFEQFLDNLDSDMESFIARANPDIDNPVFFRKDVEEEVILALRELDYQKSEHKRSIHNIRIYQQASLKDIENYLQRLEEARDKNKGVQ